MTVNHLFWIVTLRGRAQKGERCERSKRITSGLATWR